MKIKQGDTVKVIAGKDKGRSGKVTRVLPKTNQVVVEGANLVKKHVASRGRGRSERKGGIIDKQMPTHASNVMLVDPKENKPTRMRWEDRDGKKVRVAVKSGQEM